MNLHKYGWLVAWIWFFTVMPLVQAADFDPPANSNIALSPPAIGTAKSTMKATVRADGGRYAFNFSFGAGAVDKGDTVKVGDYIYKKTITWTRLPADILGSWEPHQGAGYIDAYLWQTVINTATPNYTISVKGQRRKKRQPGPAGPAGEIMWENWETEAKQFAVEITTPANGAELAQGETVTITAKAVYDPQAITLMRLKIKVLDANGNQVAASPESQTSPLTYEWNTQNATSGTYTIEASGEGTLGNQPVSDSVTQRV